MNRFLEACEDDAPLALVKNTKLLRAMYLILNQRQKIEMMEDLWPLLDSPKAHIRQCVACIIMEEKLSPDTYIPAAEFSIRKKDGKLYKKSWEDQTPEEECRVGWQAFVARHRSEKAQQSF